MAAATAEACKADKERSLCRGPRAGRRGLRSAPGGEAQRLALARAALADADVVLVDEPTEHLDDDTAAAVIDGLLAVAHGRTLIVATHDARLARRMHRTIDMTRLRTAGGAQLLEAAS